MPTSLLILKEQQRNGKEAICQILLNSRGSQLVCDQGAIGGEEEVTGG
uniref:Uncharacterized protein n=1 Tax=Populus suaveolens TaxID=245546 RepID=Q1HIU2_9ROSI|nr:unknown [Populus suaveolens]